MTRCPSIDELERLLEQHPDPGAADPHVRDCRRCQARLKRLRDNAAMLASTRSADRALMAAALEGRSTPEPTSLPQIPGYDVLAELHRGGQGIVYKALQRATKRTVALKVLLQGAFATSRQRHRFEREVELAARLRHPNLVTIFESGTTPDGWPYYVMEFCAGVPLDEFVRRSNALGPAGLTINDRVRLFVRICDAVYYAHQHGVIHRDLKPSNIVVTVEPAAMPAGQGASTSEPEAADGALRTHWGNAPVPRILDFGLAKAIDAELRSTSFEGTKAGEFLGTFRYAAPEQFRGEPGQIDTRTDVYALGVILYEMLTGQFPYPVSGSLSAVLRHIAETEPPIPSRLVPGLNDELDTILLKALSKSPERRYQSAGALQRDLLAYLAGEPIEAKRDSHWYVLRKTARRYRVGLTVAGFFVLLVAAFGVAMAIAARRTAVERDRAHAAELVAASNARRLAVALSESHIERGRSLAAAGSFGNAEDLIWREFLAPPDERAVTDATHAESSGKPAPASVDSYDPSRDPQRRLAYWALWELCAMSPCLKAWKAGEVTSGNFDATDDGHMLACLDRRGRVNIWAVPEGRLLRTAPVPPHPCTSVSLRTTEPSIITTAEDGLLRFIRLDNGTCEERVLETNATRSRPLRARISGDERTILAWTGSDALSLWDAASGRCLTTWSHHGGEISVATIGSTADHIAVACMDGTLHLWSAGPARRAPRRLRSFPAHSSWIRNVSFSHDDELLSTTGGNADDRVRVFDVRTGALRANFVGHVSHVNFAAFRRDGLRIVSGSFDNTVRLWDLAAGKEIGCFGGDRLAPILARFLDSGESIATLAADGTARIWEAQPIGAMRSAATGAAGILSLAVSPEGRKVATAGGDGTLRLLDADSGAPIQEWRAHEGVLSSVAFSPDGATLATAGYDHAVHLWDAQTGRLVRSCAGHTASINCVKFDPAGRRLASSADDETVRIWDVESGRELRSLSRPTRYRRRPVVAWSPDGRELAVSDSTTDFAVFDAATGEYYALVHGQQGVIRALAYSPDGSLIASGEDDGTLRFWNARTREPIAAISGYKDDIFAIAFAPDGATLASASRGMVIRLWDVRTRRCLATLRGAQSSLYTLAYLPDGQRLVSAGRDGVVAFWDLDYYARHIAGNIEYQAARLDINLDAPGAKELRTWANSVRRATQSTAATAPMPDRR